jgi:outer membrane protein
MRTRYLISALALFFCFNSHAALNLEQTYLLALQNDPILAAQAKALKANEQALPSAIAQMLPALSANYTTTSNSSSIPSLGKYNSRSYALNLTQPIYHPQHWAQTARALHIEKQAYAIYLRSIQDLVIRVAERYFDVLAAQDDLKFAKGRRKAFARQLEQTQQRFDVGLIPITDVYDSKAKHDEAVAQEISATNQVADRYEQLREIIKIPVDDITSFPRTKPLPLVPPNPNKQEEWVTIAHTQNLSVVAEHENTLQLKSVIRTQAAGHFPTVDATVSAQRSKSLPPFETMSSNFAAGLNINVPIFSGGGVIFRTKEARARYEEGMMQLEGAQRLADSDTRQSFRGVKTSIAEVKAFNESVNSNQSALTATQAAYEVGTRTIVDVLEAESQLLRAVRDHSVSRYNYLLRGLRLKRGAGTLTQDDLFEVNGIITAER